MLNKCCISINARCNLACKYCHFYENSALDMADTKAMSSHKLHTILSHILCFAREQNKPFTIGFAGGGEPLLDWKMLKQNIESIRKSDTQNLLSFYIITNGMLITKVFLEEYKPLYPFVKLVISLDGDATTHDTFRIQKNKSGTHAQIMSNIGLYKECCHSMPAINISVSKLSLDRRNEILKFLHDFDFCELSFTRLFHCEDKTMEISQKEFLDFIESFVSDKFTIRNITAKEQKKCDCAMYGYMCGVGYNNIFYFNDKVFPCMRFVENPKAHIGLYDSSLSDIKHTMQNLQKPREEGKCYYELY